MSSVLFYPGVPVFSGGSTTTPTLAPNGTAAAPAYSFTNGPSYGMYLGAGNNTLAFATAGVSALSIDASQNVTVSKAALMPNATTLANGITLGPSTAAGVTIWRIASGAIQYSLADGSGNAMLNAATFATQNDTGSPNFTAGYQTGYGMYINNAGPYTALVAAGTNVLKVDSTQTTTLSGVLKVQNAGFIRSGAGSPNGSVTGNNGDIYLATGGASGARLWVCSGTTVWAAVAGV